MTTNWPSADLDDVRRLHALAAGIRGAFVTETAVDAPPERVWALLSDLEGTFGDIQPDMRHVRVLRRTSGDRVEVAARSRFGFRARFDGVLRPGWCWLQSRFLIIGMAVAPEPGDRTRVALTGGLRVPGRAAILPVGARLEARKSLRRLARLL